MQIEKLWFIIIKLLFFHKIIFLKFATIYPFTVISHNASVGAKAEISAYNILNSRCTIGHDTKMGDYNFISPLVAISSNISIGNGNLIGTNACTIPGMKIGNNNKVAAGMVIYKPIENDSTVIFRHKERLIVKKE
jgi:acetyltransferase EpsM